MRTLIMYAASMLFLGCGGPLEECAGDSESNTFVDDIGNMGRQECEETYGESVEEFAEGLSEADEMANPIESGRQAVIEVVEQIHSIFCEGGYTPATMVCLSELLRRAISGAVQVLWSDDAATLDCRLRCLAASITAAVVWCRSEPELLLDGGPQEVASRLMEYTIQACEGIEAEEIKRQSVCLY